MRRLVLALCSLFLLLCAPVRESAAAGSAEKHFILRVHVADPDADIPRLAAMQLDVAGIDVKRESVDIVGDSKTMRELQEAGFFPEIVYTAPPPSQAEALSQYLDPAEVATKVDFYQTNYPTLAKKFAIGTTVEGRTEWALKISDNVNADEDEPVVLYVGQHHAREVMTTEIAFDIVDYLLTRYATDPQVQAWVNGREIWVVPCHNPDGTNTVFTSNALWRKNRRNNGGGSFGVDLNRNYPFLWGFCSSGGGASASPSDDTYRGPTAGSEPETQAIMALASSVRPVLSLSYHTYSELVINPYGCVEVVSPELRMLQDNTSDMAARMRNDTNDGWYASGTPWQLLYEVSGEADEWLYSQLGIVPTTIEASGPNQGFQPDYNAWRNSTVTRNRAGWQYLLDRIDGPSIWGHTTDACSGAALSATVGLDEFTFPNGEAARVSKASFGRYHRLTAPGSYHLRASKTGYATQVWPEEVSLSAVRRELRLVPTGSFAVDVLDRSLQDPGGDADGQADPGESLTLSVTAYATGGAVSGLTGVLATSDPYVTVSDANGAWPALAAGASAVSSDSFAFSVSPSAPDGHVVSFTLTFSASQGLCAPVSTIEVEIDTHAPVCPAISVPLDTNPGWTIQNSDGSGWAFGTPASGAAGGPTSAHTGSNVYGTNLVGAYMNAADYKLITTPFNLVGLRHSQLRFWRWLQNESGFDLASIDVSTDGVNFSPVWSGFGRDTQWQYYTYDIAALADDQATVYVRFHLQSDGSTVGAGFYLDDVSICGESGTPEPRLAVASWGTSDGANLSCTDHDAYADAGEAVDVSVGVRNDGGAVATGVVATLSSSDPRIGMAIFHASLGSLAPGASGTAAFRVTIPSGLACLASVPLRVDVASNGGTFTASDSSFSLRANGDDGAPTPDTFDGFESPSGWTITGEWQIAVPGGRGGTANGGQGSPDPTSAFGGTRVLGVDLSGLGAQIGSYEENIDPAITATSPVYNCANSTHVEVQFKRWLGVERSLYDQATIEAWDGVLWQPVWQNPDIGLSDSSWQSVAYDVTPWAAGNAAFRVRFKMTSDESLVYCGWNIDDLKITNGYVPSVCETAPCATGCTPAAQVSGLMGSKDGSDAVFQWTPGSGPCQTASGANYRVYRSLDPRPRTVPPVQWPQDSYFTDVTIHDADGSAANASYTDTESPPSGGVFYYLVVAMGTNGQEGPSGW